MIYSVYSHSIRDIFIIGSFKNTRDINTAELLAEVIKESEDDSFVFITTKNNNLDETLNDWIDKYNLRDYIVYESTDFITNPVHPHNKKNLKVYVMVSKEHFWRELTPEDIECEIEGEILV